MMAIMSYHPETSRELPQNFGMRNKHFGDCWNFVRDCQKNPQKLSEKLNNVSKRFNKKYERRLRSSLMPFSPAG
jgi:hypothetical protein